MSILDSKQQKLYISGPMTGLPDYNFPAFNTAAEQLREFGFLVSNPAEINKSLGGDRNSYLRKDIKELCDCDILILLSGWEKSDGAHLELHIAHRLGILVMTMEQFLINNMAKVTQ